VNDPPPPNADNANVPTAPEQKPNPKSKRGSVFTVAATQLMQENIDKFKPTETVTDQAGAAFDARGMGSTMPEATVKDRWQHKRASNLIRAASSAKRFSIDQPSEQVEVETEIDWSPGSEFVKFASITTLPSLKIVHPPAITDEYMATLAQYKSEFVACVFNASSNRNRSSRMKIFTGRQFVEFCLSDTCSAELRVTERGSAVGIGKLMCLYDFIHEVEDEHDFEDSDNVRYGPMVLQFARRFPAVFIHRMSLQV
jgi:hypothetical protein